MYNIYIKCYKIYNKFKFKFNKKKKYVKIMNKIKFYR